MIETRTVLLVGDKFLLTAPGHRNRKHVYTVETIGPGPHVGEPDATVFDCRERTPSGTEVGLYALPDNVLANYQARGWVLDAETGKPKR